MKQKGKDMIDLRTVDNMLLMFNLVTETNDKFNRASILDAESMIHTVIKEHGETVENREELALHISHGMYKYLDLKKFAKLIGGASLGEVCTHTIFKRYLSEEDFAKWQNDELDMSRMLGWEYDLQDIYLEAKAYVKAWRLINRIIDDIEEFNLTNGSKQKY